jgi:type I restriction enzyme S subunit
MILDDFRGAAQGGISRGFVRGVTLPIAPLPEQRRIVEAIETRFARLDGAVRALERARANLKRYRASVLRDAYTGKLVPQEANLHPDPNAPYEDGPALIRRIGGREFEPELRANPEGWGRAAIGSLFKVQVGATPSRRVESYWGGDIPWVSSGEVDWNRIRSTRESITQAGLNNSATKVLPRGTVLLGMIGQGKTRGQAAILDIEGCSNQNAAGIQVGEKGLPPEFVYYFFAYRYERTRAEGSGNQQQALNKSLVQNIVMPIPPIGEQRRIVAEIDRRFSIADEVVADVQRGLQKCAQLREVTMKWAFEGRLVAQDPNDEPASALLERIKTAGQATSEPVRRSRRLPAAE